MIEFTKNRTGKLEIYVKVNSKVNYEISPATDRIEFEEGFLHRCDISLGRTNIVSVTVGELNPGDALIIDRILFNDILLNHVDLWSQYRLKETGEIKYTYGYMSWPGVYTFKIRQNPIVHNYISYFYELSK